MKEKAMQMMLNKVRELRTSGESVDCINLLMRGILRRYDDGQYDRVINILGK